MSSLNTSVALNNRQEFGQKSWAGKYTLIVKGCWISTIFATQNRNIRDVAQPGSALAWGARGRKFESCRPDKGQSAWLSFFYFANAIN